MTCNSTISGLEWRERHNSHSHWVIPIDFIPDHQHPVTITSPAAHATYSVDGESLHLDSYQQNQNEALNYLYPGQQVKSFQHRIISAKNFLKNG